MLMLYFFLRDSPLGLTVSIVYNSCQNSITRSLVSNDLIPCAYRQSGGFIHLTIGKN